MKKAILSLVAVLAALLPPLTASAQSSTIAFVNPSGYTSTTQPPVLSAKQDADGTYHLVAWVKNVPPNPLVEFELRPTATGNPTTVTADRVGSTPAWEFDLDLSGIPDGTYRLQAFLYSGLTSVAEADKLVTVNDSEIPPPDPANTVEILHPVAGGGAGYFTPPARAPGFIVNAIVSAGTGQVRTLYSMSDQGNDPEWKTCGFGRPNDDRIATIRCAMASGDSPARVTAIAAVANRQPTGEPTAATDETGDAHHVVPYAQVPTIVDVSPTTATQDPGACQLFSLEVTDQQNRPIAGANVDIHASGPNDQLQFATVDTTPVTNATDPFQAPDRGHSTENALRCSDDEPLGRQGETNRPGGDDEKHIESTIPTQANMLGGTDLSGDFDFALHSGTQGASQITAWADVNDDDVRGTSEASGGAQLGWGQPPPPPIEEIFLSPTDTTGTTGSCVALEVSLRRGGNPLSGANVDVHLLGPDSSVNFCEVAGGGTRRAPESGGHVGDAHDDGTRHAEGEADPSGRFVFGVTAATTGSTSIQVWYDKTEDDVSSGELSRSGSITWQPQGARTISISSNRSSVARGRRVRLSGSIEGDPACAGAQSVRIEAKRLRGGSFQTVKTVTTDSEGDYTTRLRMNRSRRLRAAVAAAAPCEAATSRTVTVRVRG